MTYIYILVLSFSSVTYFSLKERVYRYVADVTLISNRCRQAKCATNRIDVWTTSLIRFRAVKWMTIFIGRAVPFPRRIAARAPSSFAESSITIEISIWPS